jgi:hypothetical protein
MNRHPAKLNYPREKFKLIVQSSEYSDEFYGVDEFELKKLHIILAKYGCRHTFHILPDKVSLMLHKFYWNEASQYFEIDFDRKFEVKLNTLEETIIDYVTEAQLYYF